MCDWKGTLTPESTNITLLLMVAVMTTAWLENTWLTIHSGGSSYGVSLAWMLRLHCPCLMLAQCWKDRIIGFSSSRPGGPQTITGPNTVWWSENIIDQITMSVMPLHTEVATNSSYHGPIYDPAFPVCGAGKKLLSSVQQNVSGSCLFGALFF